MTYSPILSEDALLQALLKDSLNGLILYQVVRNEAGKPIDFLYQLVNPAAAILLGACPEDLHGKSCKEVFPQGDELRMYYQQVAVSGQNLRVEYQLPTDGRWFEVFITEQVQETLLCFFTNITDRVLAEQELIKNLTLLQHTEELASMGSWDYDRSTDQFFWSEGMYRLFGLELGTPISLQTYVNNVLEADQPVALRFVDKLQRETLPFEETLRIRRYGDEAIIKIKGVVKSNSQEQPMWVLGGCWDITH
ncbi:PAS domain-containing protein [Spirosoma validum]|uniref:PAS domain-containing protein n=1 Tax=Spirosoma validum TaxID=2771355 RepID=A0A927GE22_9BACT|nr:PAS domain-containing protein [Spirosoma validum]MBD2754253.1 PAS domain-containing protein [Spirosoma validum]